MNRQDKPITQTIALIEQMDKDINTFAMRLKEWFAWHFPELTKIVNDNTIYAKLVNLFDGKRESVTEELKDEILFRVTDILSNNGSKKVCGVGRPEEAPAGDGARKEQWGLPEC